MASVGKPPLEDARRTTGSPKMKSRGEYDSTSQFVLKPFCQLWVGQAGDKYRYLDGVADGGSLGRYRECEGHLVPQCHHLWTMPL